MQRQQHDIREVRGLLERAMGILEEARSKLARVVGDESMLVPAEGYQQRLKVWFSLAREGGVVTPEQLHAIADAVGMDHRGLGGFFAGEGASLTHVAGGKVALNAWAGEEVEKYRAWLEKNVQ